MTFRNQSFPELPEAAVLAGATAIGRTMFDAFVVSFEMDPSISFEEPGKGTRVLAELQKHFGPLGWKLEWEGVQGCWIRLIPPSEPQLISIPPEFAWEDSEEEEETDTFFWERPGNPPRTLEIPHPPIGLFDGCVCSYCRWERKLKEIKEISRPPKAPSPQLPRVGDWVAMGIQYLKGGTEVPGAPYYTKWLRVYKVFASEQQALAYKPKPSFGLGLGLRHLDKDPPGAIVGPLTREDVKPGMFEVFGGECYMAVSEGY